MTDPAPSTTHDAALAPRIGFWGGLIAGGLIVALSGVLDLPEGLTPGAVRLVGITVLVGVWWITEALPLGATALVPFACFPLLDIMPAKKLAPAYSSPLILLLLGGFLLAKAVERSGVHRRLALHVLLRIGTSPRRLVLGFAVAAAALSMWISNTATTLIMMPIALALAERAEGGAGQAAHRFAVAVLLGTAYGASVGGMATPVGTPPNLVAMNAIAVTFPEAPPLTFVSWAAGALPVTMLVIPIVWLGLTRIYPKVPTDLSLGAAEVIREDLSGLGRWRPSEVRSLAVFGLAAVLWVSRPDLRLGDALTIPGWASLLGLEGTHDAVVAMLVSVIAFAMPSGEPEGGRLLDWQSAVTVPWGLVLLFGGGVALSIGFGHTGLSTFLGGKLAALAESSLPIFVATSTLAGTFGTEIVSNTALANITMPILAETAREAGLEPRVLVVPAALACSCAFMMPAATGPNAIVFGTGRIRIAEMVKAGFLTNWMAWAVITAVGLLAF